ncbi:hypothetical protein I547_0431 [Mycobacterium kansasii 824]|uniref:Uncharacterized protein n=1 Tax=Mycobacterium kansasii TaxID=1768 RepID=A0A1V3XXL5_MYCKA|nr:hypothetical protein I547_0431 [Mycobacterium kansasii 824]KEP43130.1 hypothetical protein MKSMC1_17860 [Mycobacterium kansasii]OOK83780.1 hypothetical protein BZL29_1027 [Mycobacterium kansasii]
MRIVAARSERECVDARRLAPTGVGIPAALGQIALRTAAVADGLDAAGKRLD